MAEVMKDAETLQYEGNEVGILISHGFTGTTQSIKPLADAFSREGYTVISPRLAGHGTSPEDMEETSEKDWILSVENAYHWLQERCEMVFVAGLSMGGTLALYIAETFKEVKGVISINGAIDMPKLEQSAEESTEHFLAAIGSDIHKEGAFELAYQETPVGSVAAFVRLMTNVRKRLNGIHCPILLFVSDEDHVVPPGNSEEIFETVFSEHKELVHLENSYHVATLDHDQDLILERSLEFFETYINTK
ncbi:alpha/beta fold hydrolase [Halobacillus salinarum]|uniref:Alpha/beta fold hydrolase n=1 Tax=Halobacillus salinarum TaxID=2932257 RepID=A0ABY4EHA7_9BACI|nr:alpha/beta fold hydrolase [Halobacillus salinarum]UOQ43278.1 alpha/beta fold hydrolase [Halobacillus salinarum]